LLCLGPAVENSLFDVRRSPCTTTRAAAKIVGAIGIHVDKILTALLCNPSWFFVIPVTECPFTLAGIVARIVIGSQFVMNRFIYFDASLF